MKKLSIVIPCYNEEATIAAILQRIDAVDLGEVEKEIIIVDDGSKDSTPQILSSYNGKYKTILNETNKGKGHALRIGFERCTGDVVIVQDADLEYAPEEYGKLIQPILDGEYKVVYGSRILNKTNERHSALRFYYGGLLVTWVTNLLYGSRLTDEPTCYKVFDRELLMSIPLECEGFEFCPEVTAKILKRKIPILEIPITYMPRNIEEGKKIRWYDGLEAIWTLVKYRFTTTKDTKNTKTKSM